MKAQQRIAIRLSQPEIDTILAALRQWVIGNQLTTREYLEARPFIESIATNGGAHEALTVSEVDALAERMNLR